MLRRFKMNTFALTKFTQLKLSFSLLLRFPHHHQASMMKSIHNSAKKSFDSIWNSDSEWRTLCLLGKLIAIKLMQLVSSHLIVFDTLHLTCTSLHSQYFFTPTLLWNLSNLMRNHSCGSMQRDWCASAIHWISIILFILLQFRSWCADQSNI